MANYPEILDNFTPKVDNTNDVMAADVNGLQTAVTALQTKVGIDESEDTTSLDYKIAQLQSGKQDSLGFTPEDVANKVTSFQATPTDTAYASEKLVKDSLDSKQATLVSGTNIKTINSISLLGSEDIAITVPVKASGSELDIGTNDDKFATAKALADSGYKKLSELKNSQSTADASSITPTGNYPENEYYVTSLEQALTINEPSGTPANGNTLLLRIKDNETARALTWNAVYTWIGQTKPETTKAGKIIYIAGIYNSTSSKWEMTGLSEEA